MNYILELSYSRCLSENALSRQLKIQVMIRLVILVCLSNSEEQVGFFCFVLLFLVHYYEPLGMPLTFLFGGPGFSSDRFFTPADFLPVTRRPPLPVETSLSHE